MQTLDWLIIAFYAAGMILLGWYVGRNQASGEDYYLAGRRLGWFPVGVSTMATQLGAISFISAPAFVGLRPGGGLIWLGYELAVPAAVLLIMAVVLPVYHYMRVTSVYEMLERRFDVRVRVTVSLIFQISRGLATGVTIYAAAIVVSVTAGIPLWLTIVLTGAVAMVYELFGGIHIDILSDTIQMIILLFGILLVGVVGLSAVGGWSAVQAALDPARFQAVDFTAHGLGDGRDFGFWPLFFGGLFLYLSYYGSDQSQVQRELSTRSLDAAKGSLLFNGLARFPIVLAYCTVGLILGAWAANHPEFLATLPGGNVDYMLPMFIREHLPVGLTGFIFVAIFAAAMSNLDSSINSLSAATMEDVYKKLRPDRLTEAQELRLGKLFTLGWGVFCVGFAFYAGDISPTVIESINKIGSAFYGPVFAVFLTGIVFRRAAPAGALTGLVLGVGTNLALWLFAPGVSWLWWNLFGFLLAAVSVMLWPRVRGEAHAAADEVIFPMPGERPIWRRSYILLALYTALLILVLLLLPSLMAG
ncbi:MAG: sodium:solute symporter [bacterium]